ncbi:MAG: polysaccharide biosynthesis/export family protein [Vicinamibacterales bacterium]
MRTLTAICLAVTCLLSGARLAAGQTDYRVGPQDVLNITVFGEAGLTGRFPVEQDGSLTYPLIGRIGVGGHTLREVENEIRARLADGYLKNPQVTAAVESYRSQRVLIIGEVRSPGEYQLTGDMTLLAALARAGATTATAGHEAVILRPRKSGAAQGDNVEVIKVDLAELQAGDLSKNVRLQDGDTVNVPRAQMVFLSGQVRAPGAYAVEDGTTVLQALTLAGGLTDRGASGRIRILRTVEGKKVEVRVKLSDIVLPGDTIVVPERLF